MGEFTKDPLCSAGNDIEKYAERIQRESLCFGCASALFGLTKLFYDLERKAFDESHRVEIESLKKTCLDSVISGNTEAYNEAYNRIEDLRREKDKIALKFFYIRFFDMPAATRARAQEEALKNNPDDGGGFSGRLDSPETFAPRPGIEKSDLWENVYLITIPKDILDIVQTGGDDWSPARIEAKERQRWITAHEMAHQIFKHFDPDDKNGLNNDVNADLFASELLKRREYYINGKPGFPKVKLDAEKLNSEAKIWVSNMPKFDQNSVASSLSSWLEETLNQKDKHIINFDKSDAD